MVLEQSSSTWYSALQCLTTGSSDSASKLVDSQESGRSIGSGINAFSSAYQPQSSLVWLLQLADKLFDNSCNLLSSQRTEGGQPPVILSGLVDSEAGIFS